MQSSLFAGISGMNANMSDLSVTGNNIANVNTVAFKSSRATFSDVLSQTLSAGGGGSEQIGLGVKMSSVQKIFKQGAFQSTNNNLDMAISGEGFFILNDATLGNTYYSRAGQFQTDKDGYIVNPQGLRLRGYLANSSGTLQNNITDLQFTTNVIEPNSTTEATLNANLDSNSEITGFVFTTGSNDQIRFSVDGGSTWKTASITTDGGLTSGEPTNGTTAASAISTALEAQNGNSDTYTVTYDGQAGKYTIENESGNSGTLVLDWSNASSTSASLLGFNAASSGSIAPGSTDVSDNASGAFSLANAGDTANFSTPVTVYDSLGNDHVVTMYFRKDSLNSTGNVWDWYAVVDGSESTTGNKEIQAQGSVTFNTDGALYTESAVTYPTGGFDFAGGADQNQSITFDFGNSITDGGKGIDGTTQFGTSSGVSKINQDGYSSGSLLRVNIDEEGFVTGVFSNGRLLTLGQVLLADFSNPGSLSGAGNNNFSETPDSGQPLIGGPGSSGRGVLKSSTLELSNVDLAGEFVNMITAQRGFQASSKVITTTDELLMELVNLKR